eukprot:CAMPEP_0170302056 /NCGR_PEP_ID=MMETSP0116_2-20130129/51302_1 /TAXON_ID=400756 /ORGANISM="Durinskia baltica, Strain CSIRO CS-38" /LENGTH=263 /DNA_ID=CAMNT_0010553907 /DNA_START=15 /DNA_END=808 /DNA_ORIENTATION=-
MMPAGGVGFPLRDMESLCFLRALTSPEGQGGNGDIRNRCCSPAVARTMRKACTRRRGAWPSRRSTPAAGSPEAPRAGRPGASAQPAAASGGPRPAAGTVAMAAAPAASAKRAASAAAIGAAAAAVPMGPVPNAAVEVMRGIKQALQQPPFAGGPREALEPAAGVERHWRGNAAGGALKDVAANRKPRRPAQVKSETAIELFGDIVDERVHLAVPARRRVPRNGPRGELGRSGTMNVCPSEGPRRSCEAVVHLRGASARGVRHE